MKSLLLLIAFLILTTPAIAQSVVVNEYANATSIGDEYVELVVVSDNLDMRGMTIRDFDGSGNEAGVVTFANNVLWSSVSQGTLIVMIGDNYTEDTDASDKVVQIRRTNTTYFSRSGSFNIASGQDAVQLRTSTGTHIHTLFHDADDFTGGSAGAIAAAASPGAGQNAVDVSSGEVMRFFDGDTDGIFVTADFDDDADTEDSSTQTRGAANDGAQDTYISTVLPVELTSFEAIGSSDAVTLSWTTASETNNAGFELQQATAGNAFTPTAFVNGYGTTLQAQSYEHTIANLIPGQYRFRLKQVDFDGAFEYSPEVEVTVGVEHSFRLSEAYPNPFNPETVFSVSVQNDQHVEVAVYNLLGQRVRQLYSGVVQAGAAQRVVFDASGLPGGMYLIQARGAEVMQSRTVTLLK